MNSLIQISEDDEVARRLEGSDVPSTTSKPQTSLSAIIVVITCLIIISILIAGKALQYFKQLK